MEEIAWVLRSDLSQVVEKADYRAEERAALTLTELERWLTLEIAGVYHHAVHTARSEGRAHDRSAARGPLRSLGAAGVAR
jgi:putative transposase